MHAASFLLGHHSIYHGPHGNFVVLDVTRGGCVGLVSVHVTLVGCSGAR
jgi:hypothetical protein